MKIRLPLGNPRPEMLHYATFQRYIITLYVGKLLKWLINTTTQTDVTLLPFKTSSIKLNKAKQIKNLTNRLEYETIQSQIENVWPITKFIDSVLTLNQEEVSNADDQGCYIELN